MNKKTLRVLYFTIGSFLTLFLFTILVKFVNVKAIGPNGSEVGLAFLNKPFMIKYNELFDKGSDLLLLISGIILLSLAFLGLCQYIFRGKLTKVDKGLLSIPFTILLTILFIVLFEIVIINYRPIIIDGNLEASYPSTHTTLIFTILLITIPVFISYARNMYEKVAIFSLYLVIAILAIVFRMLSGVHYLTDVIGGLLLAISMGSCNKLIILGLNHLIKDVN